ncbi:MAG: hypothetical protein ACLFVP_00980 [Candidatus Bathyarchaeia archaeon]
MSIDQKIIIVTMILGLLIGGVGGYLLAPEPNCSEYLSTIAELHGKITDLQSNVATLQQEIAQNKADIANYQLEITEMELKVIELKGRILELKSQAISDWEYKQLQNAYFELRGEYENLRRLNDWIMEAYYQTQKELDWTLLNTFEGRADENGELNHSTPDFILSTHDVKIVLQYRGDLYESISLEILNGDCSYSPEDNYLTLSTGKNAERLTYTRVKPNEYYSIILVGCYNDSSKEGLTNRTDTPAKDWLVKIYSPR